MISSLSTLDVRFGPQTVKLIADMCLRRERLPHLNFSAQTRRQLSLFQPRVGILANWFVSVKPHMFGANHDKIYFVLVDGWPIFQRHLGYTDNDLLDEYNLRLADLESGRDELMNELPEELRLHFTPFLMALFDTDPDKRLLIEDLNVHSCLWWLRQSSGAGFCQTGPCECRYCRRIHYCKLWLAVAGGGALGVQNNGMFKGGKAVSSPLFVGLQHPDAGDVLFEVLNMLLVRPGPAPQPVQGKGPGTGCRSVGGGHDDDGRRTGAGPNGCMRISGHELGSHQLQTVDGKPVFSMLRVRQPLPHCCRRLLQLLPGATLRSKACGYFPSQHAYM